MDSFIQLLRVGVTDLILNKEDPDPKFALMERQERPGGWRDLYQYE